MYVYLYICIFIYMYIYIYVYLYIYVCVYVCVCVCVCVCNTLPASIEKTLLYWMNQSSRKGRRHSRLIDSSDRPPGAQRGVGRVSQEEGAGGGAKNRKLDRPSS